MVTQTKEHTCEICGHTGLDVHEYPYLDRNSKEDSTRYECKDYEACLDRIGYYPRKKNGQ